MNRIILFFLIFFIYTDTYAWDFHDFDKYRLECFNTAKEYQSLVGQTILFLPVSNKYNEKFVNQLSHKRKLQILEISDKRNSWRDRKKGVLRTDWVLKDVNEDVNFEIVVYIGDRMTLEEEYGDLYWPDEVRNYDLPFYYIPSEEWLKEQSQKIVGTVYTHPLVKANYTITAYDIFDDKGFFSESVIVENSITHSSSKYRLADAQTNCFKEDLRKGFITGLARVEKPDNPEIQFGEVKVITDSLRKESYSDNFIDIILFITKDNEELALRLKNKTQHTLKIIWDEASFVDANGEASKIMHSGTRYAERTSSQPPSTIIRDAYIDDVIIPTQNVFYSEASKKWMTNKIFPDTPTDKVYNIKLMLPIQIKGVTNEYLFEIKIKYDYLHPERLNLEETQS